VAGALRAFARGGLTIRNLPRLLSPLSPLSALSLWPPLLPLSLLPLLSLLSLWPPLLPLLALLQ
jgi:hypothetical protein